jgi:hypothetical protein
MIPFHKLLSPKTLNTSDLLLDPNNPRFSELGEALNVVPESRFAEPKIQQATFETMKDQAFDVAELRDTIKTIGFLPMDRIVVRPWIGTAPDGKQLFVVIEGNRRVTALKWLLALHDAGKETFDEEKLQNLSRLECLVLDAKLAPEASNLILPGLRHVSGIKEWGPYQKAKAVHALRKGGMSPQEAAQSLGLATRAANSFYKCFLALEQMKADEEFGEFAEPNMFSYFVEVQRRPNVRNWLAWSDENEKFLNEDKLKEFYSWIVPTGDEGANPPKLPEAKSVRDLAEIISNEDALAALRAPEGSLSRALARVEVSHPEDWQPKIVAAASAVKNLTPDILRKMDESGVQHLDGLRTAIEQALLDRSALVANR